jgi:uncharacterized protein YndB with AHSA1/START domain
MNERITAEVGVEAPVEEVWDVYNNPDHVTKWNNASDDWHTPRAQNDLRTGGTFNYRMEAKDGSEGFDFTGTYDEVIPLKLVRYTMSDGRTATVTFDAKDGGTQVEVTFDPESENTHDVQRSGWQSILDNFKKYTENKTAA